ncbi:MAG: hypothetical protein V4722_09810 [Bacteroidota bacterium]
MDLIEDIKKVDEMIVLHKKDAGLNFMLSQYEARKTKLTGYLISELNAPPYKSKTSILFLKRFLDKFYTDSSRLSMNEIESNDLRRLEAAL